MHRTQRWATRQGRLTSVGTWVGSSFTTARIVSYDTMGRITGDSQCTTSSSCGASSYYSVYYGYDLLGDMTGQRNMPEGGILYTRNYDGVARLTSLQSSYNDSNHPGTLLTVNNYNPLSEVTQATLGNGIGRTLTYDNRGRLTSQTDGSVYSFSFPIPTSASLAPDSNVLVANDSVNGNWTYSYDDFARLTASNKNSGAQTFTYYYDRFGNRLQQNAPLGGPAPQYMFDANNHITGTSGLTYDAAGNISSDTYHSYTYDPEGRLLTVDGTAASYVYDAMGRRARSAIGGTSKDYIYDLAGRAITRLSSGSWLNSELYAGGTHVATYASGTTTFEHSDWLGTVRARSSVSGASVETCTSLPFGDGLSCSGTDVSPVHFTGDEHDAESNLEHTLFRQLTTTQGRWMMPDPAGMAAADPTNPQTWNRYAYVANNPVSATDSLGLQMTVSPFGPDTEGGGDGTNSLEYQQSGYCGPEYGNCGSYPDDGVGGTIGGDGSGASGLPGEGSSPGGLPAAQWPNETLGLPGGLHIQPFSLADLIGLAPGTECEFGVCVPIGMGVITVDTPDNGGDSLYTIHVFVAGSIIAGSIALHPSPIDNAINIMHRGDLNFRDDNLLCSLHITVNRSTGEPGYHIDRVNPFPKDKVLPPGFPAVDHGAIDLFPDFIYRLTGKYLIPPGRKACE